MRQRWMVVLVGAAAVVACGGDDDAGAQVDAAVAVDAPVCGAPRTIFLNRGGGMFAGGDNDSSANTSAIVQSPTTLAAPTVAPADWTSFRACLESKFAPFNVAVTEDDPGAAAHTELVVIGDAPEIGLARGVTGVSPFLCDDGPVFFERGVVFLMWDALADGDDRCWVGAQILANSFGLDHAYSCPDLMSYLDGCGPTDGKTFTDADVPCGENQARPCQCGGTTQNSFRHLTQTLGPACD